MESFELEDLTLWLVRDADEAEMWIDRWAISYPVVQMSEASAGQSIGEWQAGLQTAFERIRGKYVAVVAHGAGAAAFLAWLYQADILTRKKIANIILVPQRPDIFPDDAEHTFQRVRCPCRAALVVSEHGDVPRDWAQKQADTWNARLLVSPHSGSLNGMLGGWQWGMKLMQEMLLA
ncbi:TPA: alpha/beta hydrolase [Neisseria meningitidis]|uniref:alpha/beta hydrolase n=1 Tax=Neisseria meningitidis TaxID=487 RepID=UPI000E57E277|nr:alpha/beta hydrolase [Neisseria meningitidis]MBH2049025.1 alpha/beta hydrolase [Neisseria meningitidis]MBH2082490.1 alpha/beta hydrolase [Neisseria meningitidis]MBH5797685.1 alpha/beta hydrolase [Neisseria meningitidis]MBH5888300.1 alpha/beta hydrolase [Neisseria meningitidis]MBH5893861.1 alpha/beta hydrolase [Neisseria meningitidis]